MIPAFIYCVIAAGFAVPTLLEGNAKRLGWGFYRFAGLAACAAWPLFVLTVAVACLSRRSDRHVGEHRRDNATQ